MRTDLPDSSTRYINRSRFWTGMLLSIVILTSITTILGLDNVQAVDNDVMWIELDIEFDSVDSGRLVFFMRTGNVVGSMEPSELVVPTGIGSSQNDNLKRVMSILDNRFHSAERLFRSFLDSNGNLTQTSIDFRVLNSTDVFAFSFASDFKFGEGDHTREYFILPFIKSIKYPSVGSDNPLSDSIRIGFENELGLGKVKVHIDPGKGRSLDLQFEGDHHFRDVSDESVIWSTDLHEVHEESMGMKISDISLFSPRSMFVLTTVFVLIGLISLALIRFKNRFKGVGLILPIITLLFLSIPYLLFFNPMVNIYSTHDSFIFGSYILTIGLLIGCYFINPKGKKARLTSYEEEKAPTFEMPKVIYMEKPVYYRTKGIGNSGIDPYDILGVPRAMSTDEIRVHYKKQVLKFHPDKFHDLPENITELSKRETERLNQAFEMICKERGENT